MKLIVKPLKQKDAGRGFTAIDRAAAAELDPEDGDFIRIDGPNDGTAIARVWPGCPEDQGMGIIRIDGRLRQQAGVGIDERVDVEKADVTPAECVTIALPQNLCIGGNIGTHIRSKLSGQPVARGQSVQLPPGSGFMNTSNQLVPIKIASMDPDGTVVVTDNTELQASQKPAEQVSDASPGDDGGPSVTYEDTGGLNKELGQVREMIGLPMCHPELSKRLGIEPSEGVLLHGPPGTGKTLIVKAAANETDASFRTISGPETMLKYYGESEGQLRGIFEEVTKNSSAIIFVDEIDSIAPKRSEASGDVERRVAAQLLSLVDGLDERDEVVVIGAVNRVDVIDNTLCRGGRSDREIEIDVPDRDGRKEIMQVHTWNMPLTDDVDLDVYTDSTHGFVGADLGLLVKELAMYTLRRIRPQPDLDAEGIDAEVFEGLKVTEDDFKQVLKSIEPLVLRKVLVEVSDAAWKGAGGLEPTKERFRETIQWPLEYPEVFQQTDTDAAKGVLMYGPLGTGKIPSAKAVTNEVESSFVSIKGPELPNKFADESEKGVREVFKKARENAPTVVFFDEIDSIATERGRDSPSSGITERVASQLLTEPNGLETLEDVVIITTTNRPNLIDSALLRPGRLDRHVHVPVPDEDARRAILGVYTREKPPADDVNLDKIASKTDGYVGADPEVPAREASMNAPRESIRSVQKEGIGESVGNVRVTMNHSEDVFNEVGASVTDDVRRRYGEIEERFQKSEVERDRETEVGRIFQ